MEILRIDGIVRTERGGIVIVDDCLVTMGVIVGAKIVDECRDFPLELGVKGFNHIEAFAGGLTCDYPVDVGVVVHADTDRRVRIDVLVSPAVEGVGITLPAERIQILEVRGVVLVPLTHGGVEAIFRDAQLHTEYGGLEGFRREVALHLLNVALSEQLQVLDG